MSTTATIFTQPVLNFQPMLKARKKRKKTFSVYIEIQKIYRLKIAG